MNRILLFAVVGALVVGLVCAKPPGGKKRMNKARKGGAANDAVVGNWSWGECVPKKGDCGKGVMTGSCSGDACTTETKEKACRVKCAAAEPDTVAEPDAVAEADAVAEPDAVEPTAAPEPPVTDGDAVTTGGKRGRRRKGKKGHRGGKKQNKPAPESECEYGRSSLSECDTETGRQNKTRMLTSGDPEVCAAEMVHTLSCRKVLERKETRRCNYTLGEASECNRTSNRRYRVDTLTDPSTVSDECPLERTVEEKCKGMKPAHKKPKKGKGKEGRFAGCVYNTEASDCDAETAEITVTGSLVNVEGAPSHCKAALTHTIKCNGERNAARCGFGEWGEWSDCTDGLQERTRSTRRNTPLCVKLATEHAVC